MAIGDVKASGGLQAQLVSNRSSTIMAEGVSMLGDSVNRLAQAGLGYLNSKTDIEKIYDQRAMKSQGLSLDTKLLQYQQDRAKEFTEFSRERSANPVGMTRDYDAMLAEKENEFLETVPERFREETRARLAQDRTMRVGSAFTSELSLMDTVDTNTLNTGLTQLGSSLKGKGVSLEDAEASWAEMVMNSGLPDIDKQGFIEKGKATLQGLEFGTHVEQGASGYGSVGTADGSDVVAAGLVPQSRGVLNVIAKRESSRYDIWNGGSSFEGYEDHPAATSKAPGESTAAGRYQFILGTWRAASSSYERTYGVKVPDFSPEWQDRVALHWAEVQFNKHYSGATFKEILASGDPQKLLLLRDVLGKPRSENPNDLEWEGLGHMSDAEFIETLTGQSGFAGGGTGAADMPNVWTDPRFQNIGLDTKLGFANAAQAAVENQKQEQANQIRLGREKFLDQAYNAGYANQPGVLEALQNSEYWDAEAQAKYNSGQEVFRKAENGVAKVGAALADGTPLSAANLKNFGNWFGEDRFSGIMSGDQNAYDVLGWAVNRARVFPDGSVDAFRAAIGNPEAQQTALAFLASALAGDSSILRRSGFTQDDIADIQLYKSIAGRADSPEKAFEDYKKATDQANLMGKSTEALGNEGDKLFREIYPSASELVDKFDGWFSERPDTSLNPNTENQLMLDAGTAWRDGYKIYGTEEGAETYMQTFLEGTWGTTQTRTMYMQGFDGGPLSSKSVLMKYPPEKHYSDESGDAGVLYDSLQKFAVDGGAQPDDAILMSDEITDKEIREGKLPTYRVMGKGEMGEAILLEGRFGGEELRTAVDEGIEDRALRTSAVETLEKLGNEAAEMEYEIQLAESMGEDATALKGGQAMMDKGVKTAILAALENEQLSATMPIDPTDPELDKVAIVFAETLLTNPVTTRRLDQLSAKAGGGPEARLEALAYIIQQDFRTTKEIAAILANKTVENY
jgi:hypothetical protein